MNSELDQEAFSRANEQADLRFPLPKDTPASGAMRYGLAAFLAVLSVEILQPIVGLWWAGLTTIALGALIGWLDTKSTYRAHAREVRELYEIYAKRK